MATEEDKIIKINLDLAETNVFKNKEFETNETFWTTDLNSAYLEFTTTTDITSGIASLVLKNDDGSIVQRNIEVNESPFYYMLNEKEITHAGRWIGQVVVEINGKALTASAFRFQVKSSLLDVSEPAFYDIENYNKLSNQLMDLYGQIGDYLASSKLSESDRELAETTRSGLFTDSQTARKASFEDSQVDKDNVFAESETNRSETFVTSETERNTVFETTQNEKEALFNVKETTRQSNEDERILADNSRKTVFAESELDRTATFTESESARQVEYIANKSSFDNTLTELETFVNDDATEARFDEKYAELEATYATDITSLKTSDTSLTAQLAQTQQDFDTAVSEITVDSEVVLARGGETVLNNRLNKIASTLAVHDKDVVVSAKNEVINGNFSGVLAVWKSLFSTNTIANNTLTNTGDGSNLIPRVYQNTGFNMVMGNKLYNKISFKIKNSLCNSVAVELKTTNAVSFVIPTFNINKPIFDTLYSLSNIVTAPSSNSNISLQLYHSYADNATALGKSAELQYISLVDLTATFGAGNEPTVAQMDRLLTQFPNSWFDGTENLFLAKWALNELRRLDNDKANKKQEDWITPTLLNGWKTNNDLAYLLDDFGFVNIKGNIYGGTIGTSPFNLPVGYLPLNNRYFVCFSDYGGDTLMAKVAVTSAGVISPYLRNSSISLDNIRFKVK